MADPARVRPDLQPNADPRLNDPLNPLPTAGPAMGGSPETDPRYQAANQDPRVDNRPVVESRGAGSGVIIAAIVVALAIVAYFAFAPGTSEVPPVEPTTSAPASPPDAMAPAAPATPTAPAPDATAPAPAEPAPAPAAPAPAPG